MYCLFERTVKVIEYLDDNHGGLYPKLVEIDVNGWFFWSKIS